MAMGLSEAATATGVNRSTIYRAWKAGRLSANKTDTGQIEVEPVELFRVFPPLSQQGAPDATHHDAKGDASASADDARRADALERENKLLREALDDLRKALALADRLSLAAPIAAPGPVAPAEVAPRRSRLRWWFGWREAG
jgi:transposase-like protein